MAEINQALKPETYPYRLIEQDTSTTTLAVILPGAGYTTQGPLLHYSTGLFFNNGYDVLHINYKFTNEQLDTFNAEAFSQNVHHTIQAALQDKHYKQNMFIAKSLGTLALSSLLQQQHEYENPKYVWLTPLLHREDVYEAMMKSNHDSLCIIGDKDPCYIEERFKEIERSPNFSTKLVQDGDHSLEKKDNPLVSIEMLKEVIKEISNF